MTGKTEKELSKALGLRYSRKQDRQEFLREVAGAVSAMDDDLFYKLSEAAQSWANTAIPAVRGGIEIPEFDSAANAAVESATEAAEPAGEAPTQEVAAEAESGKGKRMRSKRKGAAKQRVAAKSAAKQAARTPVAARRAPVASPDNRVRPSKRAAHEAAAKSARSMREPPRPDPGSRPGTKLHQIRKVMLRKGGFFRKDIMEACGWPAVSVQQQAAALGLSVRKGERENGQIRYFATAS